MFSIAIFNLVRHWIVYAIYSEKCTPLSKPDSLLILLDPRLPRDVIGMSIFVYSLLKPTSLLKILIKAAKAFFPIGFPVNLGKNVNSSIRLS